MDPKMEFERPVIKIRKIALKGEMGLNGKLTGSKTLENIKIKLTRRRPIV